MTNEARPQPPSLDRLRLLWRWSLVAGGLVLVLALWRMGQFRAPELAPLALAFAFAAIAFHGAFYAACALFAPGLHRYIAYDETEIRGYQVDWVTRADAGGDSELQRWLDRWVFARNTFGLGLVPLIILGALYLFA